MGSGLAPSANGGSILRGRLGVAVLARVHDDEQVSGQVPAGDTARRRLRLLPRFRQQVLMAEGTLTVDI